MFLKCRKGSLACNGQRWHKDEIFEIDDKMGAHMVEHKFAVQVEADEYKGDPQGDSGEEAPDSAALTDLSLMNVNEVAELIENTDKTEVLEAFLEAEQAGKNRKTVIEALKETLETKLAARE